MSVRRKPHNATTMFEEGAHTLKTRRLTIDVPKRNMPTESGRGVLGGNQIISS